MSSHKLVPELMEPKGRVVGGTEQSFCRAVPGGTGIAVVAIQTAKKSDISLLQNALHNLQNAHPILRSHLHSNTTNTFCFSTSSSPFIQIKSFNLSSTLSILEKNNFNPKNQKLSPFHLILEHELNKNSWCKPEYDNGLFFATIYSLPDEKFAVVLRLHAAACDRTTGISLLNELLVMMEKGEGVELEIGNKGEVNLGIEDLIPDGKAKKSLWSRGVNMVGYSVSSLRMTNLKFKDVRSARSTQVVRLKMNLDDTRRILAGCKSRGIKLCGVLGAAGLIAAQSSKSPIDKHRKYAIVTLTDCRSLLQPPLSDHHFGFYHSAIMNTYAMKGGEKLWELANKVYSEFESYKKSNRHFTDMADINYLMCKAIDNPTLSSSSSMRTSLLSVFEDPVIENTNQNHTSIGLEDYMGCASVHGIGPCIALFDSIRDGKLDCLCVYPSPLHSREQIQDFVDDIKTILVDRCN